MWRRANVSLSTVSYAINGTRPISEETRARIFAAMDELGYRPNEIARSLASKRTRILALLFPPGERGLGITEFEFVTGATEAAHARGYHLVLWSAALNSPKELNHLIRQGLVDGLIVMEIHLNDRRIQFLRDNAFPFSMIGRCADSTGIAFTDIDFEATMRTAVHHLAELGHRHIAFINHAQADFDAGYGPAVRAHVAFEQVIQSAGLHGVVRFCHATPKDGYDAYQALRVQDPALTAIISMNERVFPGLLQAIADAGLRVPHDVSLVSAISSPRVTELMAPPLTTLAPPSLELGRLGVELLIQQLESDPAEISQVLIPCALVVSGSTGACRNAQLTHA
ncbi:MAG: LacI family DNA-binding transcriptional regulator [Anaerolineales bacterium]|nr:LacI family DNA-binding transcriptional regulator [Anaerolineales bacterium]